MQSGNCWRSEDPRNDPFVYSETPRVVLCVPLAVLCPLARKQEYTYFKKDWMESRASHKLANVGQQFDRGGFTGHPNLGHKYKIK